MTNPGIGPDNWGSTCHISQGGGPGRGFGGITNNNNNGWTSSSSSQANSTAIVQPSQQQPQQQETSKSRKHRKRHNPVGPAGVWFEQQKQQQKGRHDSKQQQQQQQDHVTSSYKRNDCDYDDEEEEEEDEDGGIGFSETQKPAKKNSDLSLSYSSNAWMYMQHNLNLTIPSLPHFLSESERCSILRPYLPDEYMLLPDLETMPSWKTRRKLLVVVETIQSLIDNLWTVRLTDETGASVVAWIQPKLVKDEQQLPQPAYIRPGYVWLLGENTTTTLLVLDKNSNCATTQQLLQHQQQQQNRNKQEPAASGNVQLRRMLLVSQANIVNVWTTSQAKEVSDEKYTQWEEKRRTLTSQAMEEFWKRHPSRDGRPSDCDDDDDDEEEEEEREWDGGLDDNKKDANNEASHQPSHSSSTSSHTACIAAYSTLSPKGGLDENNVLQLNNTGGSRLQVASDPNPSARPGSSTLNRQPMSTERMPQQQQQQQQAGPSASPGSITQTRQPVSRERMPQHQQQHASGPSVLPGSLTQTRQPVSRERMPLHQQQQAPGRSAMPGRSSAQKSRPNNTTRSPQKQQQQQCTSAQAPNFEFSKFALAAPSSTTSAATATWKSPPRRLTSNNNQIAAAEQVDDKQNHTDVPQPLAPVRPTVHSAKETNTCDQSQQHRLEETATSIGDQNEYVVNKGRDEQVRTGVESESKSKHSKLYSQESSSQKAKKRKPASTNKSLSKVWTANSQNLFNMFDDDSDDNDGDDDVLVPSKKNKNDHVPTMVEEQTDDSINAVTDSTQPPPQQQKLSLFQPSAFSGLDMDDLFDDDD